MCAKSISFIWLWSVVTCILCIMIMLLVMDHSKIYNLPWSCDETTCNAHSLKPPDPEENLPPSSSVLYSFENAAICSDSIKCSNIGRKILQKGGSAVDAAIAALICNGLMTMQSMGPGGGFVMNIYSQQEQKSYSILARERAPLRANATQLNFMSELGEKECPATNPAIAIPMEVMGYAVAHERFGKLAWRDLVEPSIEVCILGYQLNRHQRDALQMNRQRILENRLLREMFFDARTKDFHRIGTHIQHPQELCNSLQDLAVFGPRSFYQGKLANNVAADLADLGVDISAEDLSSMQLQIKPSIVSAFDEYDLHVMPVPASGAVLAYVLQLLKQYKMEFMQQLNFGALELHRIVEALKLGFVKRWQMEDNLAAKFLEQLNSTEHIALMQQLIKDGASTDDPEYYGAPKDLKYRHESGTGHISILSENGDAVSVTSSINFYFGSGHMGSRTGILFNNAMLDFNIEGQSNYFNLLQLSNKNKIHAGSMPMSSMAPVIVTNRKTQDVRLIVGAAGGSKIISALVQVLIRSLWLQQNIKEAIDAARVHHQLLPNVLEYEYGILSQHIKQLEDKAHSLLRYRERGSIVCGVEQLDGMIFGNADFRKQGGVAGY